MCKIIDEELNFYVFITDLHILSPKFNVKQENSDELSCSSAAPDTFLKTFKLFPI